MFARIQQEEAEFAALEGSSDLSCHLARLGQGFVDQRLRFNLAESSCVMSFIKK